MKNNNSENKKFLVVSNDIGPAIAVKDPSFDQPLSQKDIIDVEHDNEKIQDPHEMDLPGDSTISPETMSIKPGQPQSDVRSDEEQGLHQQHPCIDRLPPDNNAQDIISNDMR